MEQKTADCVRTANRNRALAAELLTAKLSTSPYDGAVVIAFYAAVHYINAYLWERDNRFSPQNHSQRRMKVKSLSTLRAINAQYSRLSDLGWKVRYDEGYRLSSSTTKSALDDLRDIETVILSYL